MLWSSASRFAIRIDSIRFDSTQLTKIRPFNSITTCWSLHASLPTLTVYTSCDSIIHSVSIISVYLSTLSYGLYCSATVNAWECRPNCRIESNESIRIKSKLFFAESECTSVMVQSIGLVPNRLQPWRSPGTLSNLENFHRPIYVQCAETSDQLSLLPSSGREMSWLAQAVICLQAALRVLSSNQLIDIG